MSQLTLVPPHTPVEAVPEVLHGVTVTDPYRWLEDQESPRTRQWLKAQQLYARAQLDSLPGRDQIEKRVREFVDVETYDTLLHAGFRYFFRKRLPGQEQPCIFMREGVNGADELLLDPAWRNTGKYTAVKPFYASNDGGLLVYEVKRGGERTGTFEILDVASRRRLPDELARGYLRAFTFAPDNQSFFYVHEGLGEGRLKSRTVYQHFLGTSTPDDRIVFRTEEEDVHLTFLSSPRRMLFAVYRFQDRKIGDFYLKQFDEDGAPKPILLGVDSIQGMQLTDERILALTNYCAPNRRIVEIDPKHDDSRRWIEIVPECGMVIYDWLVAGNRIVLSYSNGAAFQICVCDFGGKKIAELPTTSNETTRLVAGIADRDEVVVESQSFFQPSALWRYSISKQELLPFAPQNVGLDATQYQQQRVEYRSNDGSAVPMFLVGRRDAFATKTNPVIMTAYGGFGKSMTPQFSIFVAILMDLGCLFALPNIRGGLECGVFWHEAARRRKRATAVTDFLCAAQWLIDTGRTTATQLAIFGGSNSGLLVGAAVVSRPDLFAAAVCIAPLLDMFRYHLFDSAALWKDEFGTVDDPDDFAALREYSPYQLVRNHVAYPAVMLISGDADQNCSPMHARKMTARLQEANTSTRPIILDYHIRRGHSPVLPLSTRIEALTDRLAFVCRYLHLPLGNRGLECD